MECKYCKNRCIKKGMRHGVQKYQCKHCGKYQQAVYLKRRIKRWKYYKAKGLNKENCGVSSMSRLLNISKTSVLRLLRELKARLKKPVFKECNQSYEIDEIKTFCGNKGNETWLIYAINRETKQVIEAFVGRRTKENIKKVTDIVLKLNPKHIYTDKLNIYRSLLPERIHKYYKRCTNHIERMNLTIRTQLKPLNRKTIGFTRSEEMLYCKFCLWAWG